MSQTFNMSGGAGGGIKLASISIITPPDKTAYRPGQTFDPAGMVVQAVYDNGATATATGWTYTPSGALAEGMESVTILYTEGGVTAQAQQAVTVQKASIPVPTQSGSLTYNGGTQSPNWSGYDTEEMTIGGVTSGTNAGSYNAVFNLRDTVGTQWQDGTIDQKPVAWTIQKAVGILSISPETMTLDTGTPSKVINVTRSGTGAITAQSSEPTVAEVSVNENQVTVNGISSGSAVITVNSSGDENYTAPEGKKCSVSVVFAPANFSDATWDQIIAVCQSKTVPDTWVAGNQKEMTIGDKTYRVDIIGINHDTYTTGGTAPLTFQLKDSYEAKQMNTKATNGGGWNDCYVRITLLPEILDLMPPEVKTAIREVQKKTSEGEQSSTIQTTNDKLFLLSEIEIYGKTTNSFPGEGTEYDYYKAGNKKTKAYNGQELGWWERSPYSKDSVGFCRVNNAGGASEYQASNSAPIAFAFCF